MHLGRVQRERDLWLIRDMCPDSSSGRASARKAGDLESNPSPGANFSLNILHFFSYRLSFQTISFFLRHNVFFLDIAFLQPDIRILFGQLSVAYRIVCKALHDPYIFLLIWVTFIMFWCYILISLLVLRSNRKICQSWFNKGRMCRKHEFCKFYRANITSLFRCRYKVT